MAIGGIFTALSKANKLKNGTKAASKAKAGQKEIQAKKTKVPAKKAKPKAAGTSNSYRKSKETGKSNATFKVAPGVRKQARDSTPDPKRSEKSRKASERMKAQGVKIKASERAKELRKKK